MGNSMALKNEIKNIINEMADAVRRAYSIDGPIKNITMVVKNMGGKIVEDASIDGFSDGRIKKVSNTSFEITVSPYQSEERKNFTIAHELGHLFLHMGYKTDRKKWKAQDNVAYYRNGDSELEYQANEFAAAFLMPQDEYKEVMDRNTKGNMVDTSEVAKYFNVSIDAAANRGKWLGYLRW